MQCFALTACQKTSKFKKLAKIVLREAMRNEKV